MLSARHEVMVFLCRDCGFTLFKMDEVCGGLREEMQDEFVSMMEDCRKYSPDLFLLNHRLRLGKIRWTLRLRRHRGGDS